MNQLNVFAWYCRCQIIGMPNGGVVAITGVSARYMYDAPVKQLGRCV